jgi:hypothetical protein
MYLYRMMNVGNKSISKKIKKIMRLCFGEETINLIEKHEIMEIMEEHEFKWKEEKVIELLKSNNLVVNKEITSLVIAFYK